MLFRSQPEDVTVVLHKPTGIVVTAIDDRGRTTVFDILADPPPHLRYVGRLDRDTSGLLILTTDGELAHRLTHPRYEVLKTYEATVDGVVAEAALERLELTRGFFSKDSYNKLRDEILKQSGRQ